MRVTLTIVPERLPKGLTPTLLRTLVRESCVLAFPKVFTSRERGVKLEVVLVTDKKIQSLNEEYRGKRKPTDVLSFGNYISREAVVKAKEKTLDLGTLVLSLPFIRRSAKEDGVSWDKEFIFVFSHGVLHLLGFDHEEQMFAIQDDVTARFSSVKNK